jgi:hypothetical protein
VECAELHAYNGTVIQSTPEYRRFEKKLNLFANKYNLINTNGWANIDKHLLKATNQYLTNGEIREIIISLLGFKTTSIPKYSSFDRIFISHSSKDVGYVEPFVRLMEFIGLDKTNMFCSSIHDYGIPLGKNIYEYLKSEFTDKNILVVMMLSDNYYDSKPSLNEMGATWAMSKEYVSILLNGFEFSQIEGSIDPQRIGFKINDVSRLNEFKDKLISGLNLSDINYANWERERNAFLTKISSIK